MRRKMQSQCSHYHSGGSDGIFPVRALTAYNFLRSYNQFLTPQAPGTYHQTILSVFFF